MKKILLFLFLILGAYSFAAPSYVDLNKIQRDGYQIDVNDNESLGVSRGRFSIINTNSLQWYKGNGKKRFRNRKKTCSSR